MENKMIKKKTQGRQKIEIKKIQNKLHLQVTFTKRKYGVFKKASELSVLCDAQIAILLQSPAGKIFAFENPSVEDLINRVSDSPAPLQVKRRLDYGSNKHEYEKAARMLKEESVDGLGLQELESYLTALEGLRKIVEGEIEKKSTTAINSATALAALPIIQDFGCAASPVDQDFSFVDQDLGSSTTAYADEDFSGFYASTTDQDLSTNPYSIDL